MIVLPFPFVEGSSCGGHKMKIDHGSKSRTSLQKNMAMALKCVTDFNVKPFLI